MAMKKPLEATQDRVPKPKPADAKDVVEADMRPEDIRKRMIERASRAKYGDE